MTSWRKRQRQGGKGREGGRRRTTRKTQLVKSFAYSSKALFVVVGLCKTI